MPNHYFALPMLLPVHVPCMYYNVPPRITWHSQYNCQGNSRGGYVTQDIDNEMMIKRLAPLDKALLAARTDATETSTALRSVSLKDRTII